MTSQRTRRIQASPTLVVSSRAAELRAKGRDVIDLGAGEPDFDTPEHIKNAARQALDGGETKYTSTGGTAALREAIVDKLQRENGLAYHPDDVIVSCGAKHSLYNLMQAVLDPGDEIIVPTPYWVSYTAMATLADASPVFVKTTMEDGFKITPDQLTSTVTARTRMVILNSPANPTGAMYTRAELERLGETLRTSERVLIVSDDIYEHIRWRETAFCNLPMACPDLLGRCVVINGVSKAFAMTGWRIGYAAGPDVVIAAMKKVQSQSTSNPNSIAQAASVCALNSGIEFVEPMVREFERRHQYAYERLRAMENVRCQPAAGTFYLFPDIRAAVNRLPDVEDDVGFAARLLDAAGVAVVPGTAFGAPGHVRISFAIDRNRLELALDRIEAFVVGDAVKAANVRHTGNELV